MGKEIKEKHKNCIDCGTGTYAEKEFDLKCKECGHLHGCHKSNCLIVNDTKEFDLSEKIGCDCGCCARTALCYDDIKEFIRLSRQNRNELFKKITNGEIIKRDWDEFMMKEDKLAGKDLI